MVLDPTPLPGTEPLTLQGDLAAQMVAGIDRYLTHAIAASADARAGRWRRDLASHEGYAASVAPNRERLRRILGAVDPRATGNGLEFVATTTQPSLVGVGAGYQAHRVRWPALAGVDGEGLLLVPDGPPRADVIALADCDVPPEKIVGLEPGVAPEAQFARRLAERGCRVLVPFLIDRSDTYSGDPAIRMTNQPHREFVYRGAFEMGRHVIGYEIQKILAAIDALARDAGDSPRAVGVIGHGEGGLLALYSAALDPRIAVAAVCGCFGPREALWREPIYRNVRGLLTEFGDAEIATLVAPRPLLIEACRAPEIEGPPPRRDGRSGAAPGVLTTPPVAEVRAEVERARALLAGLTPPATIDLIVSGEGDGPPGSDGVIEGFLRTLTSPAGPLPEAERLNVVAAPGTPRSNGLLLRTAMWEPLEESLYQFLSDEFGETRAVAPRAWYFGAQMGEQTFLALGRGERRSNVRAIVGMTPSEVDITHPEKALLAGRWFRRGDVYAMVVPKEIADALNISLEAVDAGNANCLFSGIDYSVIGVLDNDNFRAIKDLDQEPLTPVDFILTDAEAEPAERRPGDSGSDAGFREYTHLEPNTVFFVPYQTLMNFGGEVRSIAINFLTGPEVERVRQELMRRLGLNLYARGSKDPSQLSPSPFRGGGPGGGVNSPTGGGVADRLPRQLAQLVEFTQSLMRDSGARRTEFWRDADATSVETWRESTRRYRDLLWDEVVGRLPAPSLPPNARTRRVTETPAYTGYEVVLDVWDDVFAYGILLLPNDLRPGERRPVVVCQHGLEGRPQDVADPAVNNASYNQYACRLAERGFITYAPQNPYIGEDRFRVLQRKANPLGASLFSIIVRQHEQTLNWLESLPFVDPERIAFYGLSYGGKSAMRVPALLERYCLSICSADYNEWIWKNVSSRSSYSYLFTGEYEMFEFDLGHTFNYAEMSWLICPRPFMVERGHHDGVAPDEWVAYEYARTRRRYALLGLADRTEIEFFDGPHTIHGVGTFAFLHKHLRWP